MLLTKKSFFCFWPPKLVCCYSWLITKQNLLKDPNSNGTHIQPKPLAIQNIFTTNLNTMGNSLLWMSKLINPNPLHKKNIYIWFFWTKSIIRQKIKLHAPIIFKNPASSVSWLCPNTRYRANIFSNQCAKISSTLIAWRLSLAMYPLQFIWNHSF